MSRKASFGVTAGMTLFLILLAAATFVSLNRYLTNKTEQEVHQIAEVYLQGVADAEYNRFSAIKKLRFAENDAIIAPVRSLKRPVAETVAVAIRQSASSENLITCALISESGSIAVVKGKEILSIDAGDSLLEHLLAGERYVTSGYTEPEQVIIYASPFSAPMENGENSAGLLCMYPMETFIEVMNLGGGHALVSFQVLREDGSYVIRNDLSVGDDIYDNLENYETSPDTDLGVKNKELEYAISHDESYMMHIDPVDAASAATQRRSMYGAPMPESDLYLLTVMPYGVLGQTVETMSRSRDQGTLLAVIVVSLGVLLVFLLRLYLSRQQMRALDAARILAEEASARAEEEAQDATDARRATEDAMVELKAAKDEAVRARVEAENASRAKSEFLSNMSHDIRTPINGIMGMTDIAQRHMDDPERVADCLQKIDGSSKHLLSLVNDVLDMSRIEAGKVTEAHAPFNLRALAGDCASIIQGQLANRDVRLITDCENVRHPRLIGDELHLRQIFINILGNSVKFTRDGDSITLRARELSCEGNVAMYRFELEDTGAGMSAEFLPKLFDSFSQEDGGSRTTYAGTGLGMAITKRLIELLHGTVEVWSEPGAGTRFTIDMPFDVDIRPEEKTAQPDGEDPDIHGMKVLVAEDNAINMQIAVMILTESGATVFQAVNGRLAVETFAASGTGEIDAILMDLMMPEMNGIEAAKAIRALDRPDAASVPIIALTANAYQQDIDRVREAGMDLHLAKPLEIDKLLGALAHFNRKEKHGQTPSPGSGPA